MNGPSTSSYSLLPNDNNSPRSSLTSSDQQDSKQFVIRIVPSDEEDECEEGGDNENLLPRMGSSSCHSFLDTKPSESTPLRVTSDPFVYSSSPQPVETVGPCMAPEVKLACAKSVDSTGCSSPTDSSQIHPAEDRMVPKRMGQFYSHGPLSEIVDRNSNSDLCTLPSSTSAGVITDKRFRGSHKPPRPPLENQMAVCQPDYVPFESNRLTRSASSSSSSTSSSEEDEIDIYDPNRARPPTMSNRTEPNVANRTTAVVYQTVKGGNCDGGASSLEGANVAHSSNVSNIKKGSTRKERTEPKPTSSLAEEESDSEAELAQRQPEEGGSYGANHSDYRTRYFASEVPTPPRNWRLVERDTTADDEDNDEVDLTAAGRQDPASAWLKAIKDLRRPTPHRDSHRRSFDSLTPECERAYHFNQRQQAFDPYTPYSSSIHKRRQRTGSAIYLDGNMVGAGGHSLFPSFAFCPSSSSYHRARGGSDSRKSSSGSGPQPVTSASMRVGGGGGAGRKSSLFQYGGGRPNMTNLALQMRRQSAAAFPHRLPHLPLNQSSHTSRQDLLDHRRTSAASLAALTCSLHQHHRSPSQQWAVNRSGNLMPTLPMVNVTDGPSGVMVGPPVGHSSSAVDVLGNNDHRPPHNPLYDVSNEFMRVTGYTQQFKRLLSKRKPQPKRQSSAPTNPLAAVGASFDHAGSNKDSRSIHGLGSSHELHDCAALTTAVVLGGRRPPTPTQSADGNGTVPGATTIQMGDVGKTGGVVKFGKQRSAYGRLWKEHPNFKHRLKKRKNLFFHRIKVSDFSLLFALAGIVLTVMEAELSSAGIIRKTDVASFLIRGLVVVTTIVLIALIVCYHAIETKIAVIDSGAEDWRVAITQDRIWQCAIEVLICSVCPFPSGDLSITWDRIDTKDHRTTTPIHVPLDAVLSIPMFLRSYLACRFMALHSRQFQDAATRSIAALNHIAVNFTFVLKTLMHEHPLRVLVLFTVTFWVAMSWILTQCERHKASDEDIENNHYLNSVWFVIITFMSIGYGDIVPNTYCGRALAITTGIVGAGVSSALIAVISRKLELSRAEKHVNQFMTDSKLTRQRKEAAASVLQHTWFIHKYKNIPKEKDDTKLRLHQRKFLASINDFRRVKWDQRKLAEQGNALVDVAKLQNDMHETLWDMQQNQDHLVAQLALLMQKVQDLQDIILTQNAQQQHQQTSLSSSTSKRGSISRSNKTTTSNSVSPNKGAFQQSGPNSMPFLANSTIPSIDDPDNVNL